MKYFIVLFSFFFAPLIASAQPDTLWTRVINAQGFQAATSVLQIGLEQAVIAANNDQRLEMVWINTDGVVLQQSDYDNYHAPRPRRLRASDLGNIELMTDDNSSPNVVAMDNSG